MFDISDFRGLFHISATFKAVMEVNYRVIMFENSNLTCYLFSRLSINVHSEIYLCFISYANLI